MCFLIQATAASEQAKRRLETSSGAALALQERVDALMAATAAALGETTEPAAPSMPSMSTKAAAPTRAQQQAKRIAAAVATGAFSTGAAAVVAPTPLPLSSSPTAMGPTAMSPVAAEAWGDDDAWDVSEEPGPMYSAGDGAF